MPITYVEAPAETIARVRDAMAKYHPGLRDAKVNVTTLNASGPRDENGELAGPAIKIRGHAAMACIKITSLKDRAAGLGDAVLTIDADESPTWSEETWEAVLDHELCHLELKTDKDGGVVRDDLGRPKIKSRKHDFEIGGFYDVTERHKGAAVEAGYVAVVGKVLVKQACFEGF